MVRVVRGRRTARYSGGTVELNSFAFRVRGDRNEISRLVVHQSIRKLDHFIIAIRRIRARCVLRGNDSGIGV